MEPLLRMEDLHVGFSMGSDFVSVVDGVSIRLDQGKCLGIVGESGCGKSVTALSVLRLLPRHGRITGGRILFEGKNILDMDAKGLRDLRGGEISMIFQDPMVSLNPLVSIGRQIDEVQLLHHMGSPTEARKNTLALLDAVGIPDPERVANGYPHQISGGMQQRAMIAMALVCNPKLMIADEPTTALDVTIEVQILDLIRGIRRQRDMGLILISHDLGIVAETSDEVMVMYAGRVLEEAPTGELFRDPRHPYTQGLLASLPGESDLVNRRKQPLDTIPGTVPDMRDLPAGCKFLNRCTRAREACAREEPELQRVGAEGHRVRCLWDGIDS